MGGPSGGLGELFCLVLQVIGVEWTEKNDLGFFLGGEINRGEI